MTDEGGPSDAPGETGESGDDADDGSGPEPPDESPGTDATSAGSSPGDADGETADSDADPDAEGTAAEHDPEALASELDRLRERVDDLAADRAETDDLADLREELADLEDGVEDRTVHRDEIERDLERYVRKRVRRGHARGWGPYLVLLYGTVMTLGVFYFFQNSAGYAIFAMLIIWLSTLGLYSLMLVVNGVLGLLEVPGRARDLLGTLRSLRP